MTSASQWLAIKSKKQCPTCGKDISPNADNCMTHRRSLPQGSASSAWRGGRITTAQGYSKVMTRGHHRADPAGYVYEHLLVMETKIERALLQKETVHHINGIRNDNRPENLELWSSHHPPGQRVEDKLVWAKEFIAMYEKAEAV